MYAKKKVVVGLTLLPEVDRALIETAKKLKADQADVHLVHAVEYMVSYEAAYGVAAGVDIESMLTTEAGAALQDVAATLQVSEGNYAVMTGTPKMVLIDYASNLGADLVVVGSHGRHGVALLLGSTANAVLHHAKCDVLAVRIDDN